jgi:hypothetical protein
VVIGESHHPEVRGELVGREGGGAVGGDEVMRSGLFIQNQAKGATGSFLHDGLDDFCSILSIAIFISERLEELRGAEVAICVEAGAVVDRTPWKSIVRKTLLSLRIAIVITDTEPGDLIVRCVQTVVLESAIALAKVRK